MHLVVIGNIVPTVDDFSHFRVWVFVKPIEKIPFYYLIGSVGEDSTGYSEAI